MTDKFKLDFPTPKDDGEYIAPRLTLEVPIDFRFGYASKTLSDFKDELLKGIENKTDIIFKVISYLSHDIAYENADPIFVGEYIYFLTEYGKGLTEIATEVREQFDGDNTELAEKEKAKETVLDLSSQTTVEKECIDLAKHLSAVLRDEKTPTALYNAIVDGLGSINLSKHYLDSPEYLKKVLCQEAENE